MPVDLSVYQNIPTLRSALDANSARNLQMATGQQALQGAQIDTQTKQNAYATQIISAGAAGGQQSYDAAKQHLQGMGIDISGYAPDVATGAQQAAAARQALISPLGMMNAQIQAAGVGAKIADVNGTQAAPIGATALPSTLPGARPAVNLSTPIPQPDSSNPGMTLPGATAPSPDSVQTSALPQPDQPAVNPAYAGAVSPPAKFANMNLNTPIQPPPTPTGFVPTQGLANENPDARNKRIASELAVYNASPAAKQADAKAVKLGTDQADATKASMSSSQSYEQAQKVMDSMTDLVNKGDVPDKRYGLPASVYASASQNFGDQKRSAASDAFSTLNEAQTITAIKELANTGQIKMSRTLENIINKGYLVDPNSSDSSKLNQIQIIKTELANSRTAAQNIDASMNGGTQQSLADVPNVAQAPTPSQISAAKRAPDGNYYLPDPSRPGKYLMVK